MSSLEEDLQIKQQRRASVSIPSGLQEGLVSS